MLRFLHNAFFHICLTFDHSINHYTMLLNVNVHFFILCLTSTIHRLRVLTLFLVIVIFRWLNLNWSYPTTMQQLRLSKTRNNFSNYDFFDKIFGQVESFSATVECRNDSLYFKLLKIYVKGSFFVAFLLFYDETYL